MLKCPLCGQELTEIERDREERYIDPPDEADDWSNKQWDEFEAKRDESTWLKCTHCKSFGDDYPLIMHHPLGSIRSRPGDSWSLSWVK